MLHVISHRFQDFDVMVYPLEGEIVFGKLFYKGQQRKDV